ncbi:MAG: hypothetical protein BACC_04491 [Bacteroides sp.]
MQKNLNANILALNLPGQAIEVSQEEAKALGAIEDPALSEQEAAESSHGLSDELIAE